MAAVLWISNIGWSYKNSIFLEVKLCIGLEISIYPLDILEKKWYESDNIHGVYWQKSTKGVRN